jgi:hypothetical protein
MFGVLPLKPHDRTSSCNLEWAFGHHCEAIRAGTQSALDRFTLGHRRCIVPTAPPALRAPERHGVREESE